METTIERLNQIDYLNQLLSQQPQLITESGKATLILKPKYRNRVLSKGASAESIIQAEYNDSDQKNDL